MLTLADFFCGAGGSSTGATQVPGVTLRAAANHWGLAVETHSMNHPGADHIQADLSQYDPRYFPRTDLAWFSPECTNHSRAKGRKAPSEPDLFGETLPDEAAERSRATMWDVIRFTEHHSYRAVIIGDRARPLAEKTRRRIAAGIARYWGPIHLESAGHTYDAADPKHVSYGDPNAYYRSWPATDPLKTLHTIESKALAVPVEGRDGKDARPASDPMRTLTTRAETGLALIAEIRGGRSYARHGLVTPYYGSSREALGTDRPLGTLTTVDRYALVTRSTGARGVTGMSISKDDLAAAEAYVDNVLFRMLEPSEIKEGMGFPSGYAMLGTRREQVRLAGNAVCPQAARDLVGCVVEAITGEQVAA